MKLKPTEILWVYSMGKRFPVTAIFQSESKANAHMAAHPNDAVIAVAGGSIIIASKYSAVQP